MKPKHADGKTDGRYSVTLEYTGQSKIQAVARFCGEWLGSADTVSEAWEFCNRHQVDRLHANKLQRKLDAYRQAYGRQNREV